MGYAVVHMMKMKAGAARGLQSHNNREHPPKTNPDVNLNRSWENYDLVPCRNYAATIKEKIQELVVSQKAVRKDAVVCCNFIVTSDEATMKSMSPATQRAFFEDAVAWFGARYGEDRILNATVHMDETTPHLHLGVLPITQDGRLSAKAIFTKAELKAIQTEFVQDVASKYGLERGVEGSERTHMDEMRFKAEQALDMANELLGSAQVAQQEAQEATQKLQEAQESLDNLVTKEKALKASVAALEAQRADLEVQIGDARAELQILDRAISQRQDDGAMQFGWGEMQERLAAAKADAARENRLRSLEAFVQHPQIKPLWEQFQRLQEAQRGRRKSRDHEFKPEE